MAQVNRYSTVITWVKVILPILGILLLSSLFLLSRSPNPDAAIPFADVDVEQIARDQRLSHPRFAGTLDDGREVILVAETAMPSGDQVNLILLDAIQGRVDLAGRDFIVLEAGAGRVNLAEQVADLDTDVRLRSSQGYRLSSDALRVALAEFRLASPGPVALSGPDFDLEAGNMVFTEQNGRSVLSFNGGVALLYTPGQ